MFFTVFPLWSAFHDDFTELNHNKVGEFFNVCFLIFLNYRVSFACFAMFFVNVGVVVLGQLVNLGCFYFPLKRLKKMVP